MTSFTDVRVIVYTGCDVIYVTGIVDRSHMTSFPDVSVIVYTGCDVIYVTGIVYRSRI